MPPGLENISAGMTKEALQKIFPLEKMRTYRTRDKERWLTFDYKRNYEIDEMITFHLKDSAVQDWKINDREEAVREYLGEFAPGNYPQIFPKMYQALTDVFNRIPYDVFFAVTSRREPTVFVEYFTTGTAKYANSSAIYSMPDDPPTFQKGVYIMKLNADMEQASDVAAIEGVIAHELAHRVLGHLHLDNATEQVERDANNLIKEWGFTKEYNKASELFGQHSIQQNLD